MNNSTDIKDAVSGYVQYRKTFKAILVAEGVTDTSIETMLFQLPDFNKILPNEAVALFLGFKRELIWFLSKKGYSQREISRRLGVTSVRSVNEILKEDKWTEI